MKTWTAGRPESRPDRVEHVVSDDGTPIGYLTQGSGPGLVLVQGAMADARAFAELAQALAGSFTVHSAERRGRGLSPRPYDHAHRVARDVEDLDAVLAATGATGVFGLSSGAAIALAAARTPTRIDRVAVFEPPLPPGGLTRDRTARLSAEIERGALGSALVSALLTAGTAPAPLRRMPRPLARALGRAVLEVDARVPGSRARLRDLLPGVRYDFDAVADVNDEAESLADVTVPVLLLTGSRSPAFLRDGTRALTRVVRDARHVELAGLGHSGPWNRSRGGRPEVVAAELLTFFGAGQAQR